MGGQLEARGSRVGFENVHAETRVVSCGANVVELLLCDFDMILEGMRSSN